MEESLLDSTILTQSQISDASRGVAAGVDPCASNCQGSGLRVEGVGCRVQGSGFRVEGLGLRVEGAGCRVQG